MKIAAIDIGSNSIKLIVVEATSAVNFKVLAREKETVRLGRGTLREHRLSPEAITSAAETIKRFNLIANVLRVEHVITIATAAVREADNANEFVQEIGKRTGVHTEVLSGAEEARLIGIAADCGCGVSDKRNLVHANIDIGGGSTEFSIMQNGEPLHLASVRLGAVGLTERMVSSETLTPEELQNVQDEVYATLQNPSREIHQALGDKRITHVTGTSGTIIAIGEALRAANKQTANKQTANNQATKNRVTNTQTTSNEANGKQIDAKAKLEAAGNDNFSNGNFNSALIGFRELEHFNEKIAALNFAARRQFPGISAQRAEIIIAGGQILAGAMRALHAAQLRTCDWALREGAIVDRLREMEAERKPPVPDRADPRLRGVHLLGTQFRYEEKHARHVAYLAETMFDDLAKLHNLKRHERTLLAAAALLHDIGYAIAHDPHHKHSHYIIKNSELTGFSAREQQIIALIARYHRGALPKERHTEFAALAPDEQKIVWQLGGILRLAEALDRSHDKRIRTVKCRTEKRDAKRFVRIDLICDKTCRNELRAAINYREMFETAFDCKVAFQTKNKR